MSLWGIGGWCWAERGVRGRGADEGGVALWGGVGRKEWWISWEVAFRWDWKGDTVVLYRLDHGIFYHERC